MSLCSLSPKSLVFLQLVDGETSPPPLLKEADLIALMEKHGIGEATLATTSTICVGQRLTDCATE